MNKHKLLLGTLVLASLVACGGGGGGGQVTPPPPPPPVNATTLSYTDPVSVPAGAFQFKKSSSQGGRLVLELHGPATALRGAGIVLTLNVDTTKATWASLGPDGVIPGSVLSLGPGTPILKGKASGGTLQVVISEKGTASAKVLTGPLLQVALDLKSGVSANTVIVPTVDLAKSKVLLADGSLAPVADLKFGTLTAQ